MRIRCHDDLANIIYKALLQDHPGALNSCLKEQRISYNDGLHPFHSNFQHGRSAYFDISVRCTTQLAYISSSSVCAGELAKDEKHASGSCGKGGS